MPHDMSWRRSALGAMVCLVARLTPAFAAPQFAVLHNFEGPAGDGAVPLAGVLVGPGVLYGTTSQGGSVARCGPPGCGTVYQLAPPAGRGNSWTETLLTSFPGPNDGAVPESDLAIDATGTLYGTTYKGGRIGLGTAFSLTPPATEGDSWSLDDLYSFGATDSDGELPVAGLVAGPDGSYYGTTMKGGVPGPNRSQLGYGTVFQLLPPNAQNPRWTHTRLYSFPTLSLTPQGNTPAAGVLLTLTDGSLLGATCCGGSKNGGVVFDLLPPANSTPPWTETIAHNFVPEGSKHPNGALVTDGSGAYYGTSSGEAAYAGQPCHGTCGIVYELVAPTGPGGGWSYSVLYTFKGDIDGAVPRAGLVIGPGGVLYGTTFVGGDKTTTTCLNIGCGTVFQLSPPSGESGSWTETVLHRFHGSDGQNPEGRLAIDSNGFLYGTTTAGGSAGFGTVFRLVP